MHHGHGEISTGQRRTLYWPLCTSMACKYHPPCLGDCLPNSWFKCETESCYRSPHLFLPLFPCGEKQRFQKTVQWQVKAHNFMPLLCFNTNSASVESERLRQRIESCTWAALTTDNDAIEPNFFSEICIGITLNQGSINFGGWIFIKYTQCLFAFLTKNMSWMKTKRNVWTQQGQRKRIRA